MRNFKLIFLVTLVSACASSPPDNTYPKDPNRPLVDEKYSLKADREKLEELRAQIPENKRKENDELALILNLMAETNRPPADIRSQFDQRLRKKREMFDKDLRKEREDFTKKERLAREEFMKEQKEARELKQREKMSRDEKNAFYKQLDERRSEYFSVERDRRQDYESDARERRKNFEDYAREKQNQFNQEMRSYQKKYDQMKAEERKQATSPEHNPYLDEESALEQELSEVKKKKGYFLQSGDLGQ